MEVKGVEFFVRDQSMDWTIKSEGVWFLLSILTTTMSGIDNIETWDDAHMVESVNVDDSLGEAKYLEQR